jgi:hypothetical protein
VRLGIFSGVQILVLAAALTACASSPQTTSVSPSPSPSPAGVVATATPIDLALPTTIYAGGSTTGAQLSAPSAPAKVSAKRALRGVGHLATGARLTGQVLADVTMPGASHSGEPLKDLTSWVFVYTFAKPFDARIGDVTAVSPSASPTPLLVSHGIFIVDASDGDFVLGYFAK